MPQPLVSVIMPMHNSERFVGEAIESVLNQTYCNWELLVIDDDSNDNSVEIVRKYAAHDSRIRLLFNDNHVDMPSAPRNMGIEYANGQFIAFLDSDDIWLKDKLKQQLPLFEDNCTAVAYSDYEKIDEKGNRSARVVTAPLHADYRSLLRGNIIGNLTGMFDVGKIGKNYFLNIHHEDYAFWLSALKNGYVACSTGTITALYREHNNSISSHKLRNIVWQWNIYRNVEHISVLRSLRYFVSYAIKGIAKSLI